MNLINSLSLRKNDKKFFELKTCELEFFKNWNIVFFFFSVNETKINKETNKWKRTNKPNQRIDQLILCKLPIFLYFVRFAVVDNHFYFARSPIVFDDKHLVGWVDDRVDALETWPFDVCTPRDVVVLDPWRSNGTIDCVAGLPSIYALTLALIHLKE